MGKCERCGKPIESRGSRARFCSVACRLSRKRKELVYVYAMGWGPSLGSVGIKRYEVRQGRKGDFIRPFSFDFIPLPTNWNPEAFKWRFVGIRHDPERKTIERKSSYWFAEDAFPEKYYSLKQIENQWRKLQTEPKPEREPWGIGWDDYFKTLDREVEPRRKAKELLGVSLNATPAEIRTAYRKKALEHHPDHGGDANVFAQISAAYELLSTVR